MPRFLDIAFGHSTVNLLLKMRPAIFTGVNFFLYVILASESANSDLCISWVILEVILPPGAP
jgi:hypothetical protein